MNETDQYAKYTNCRNALGVSLWDVIKQSRSRKISDVSVEAVFSDPVSRDDAICQLRDCGMSLDDIGKVIGMTRERVRQIIKESGNLPGKSNSKAKPSSSSVSDNFVIGLLCRDTRYWSNKGTGACLISEIEAKLESDGYTTDQIRQCFVRIRIRERNAKARLLIRYWFNIPEDEHRQWLSLELRSTAQAQLLDRLNGMSPIKLSIMAFNRYMRNLGITAYAGAQGIRRTYGGDDNDWSWMKK